MPHVMISACLAGENVRYNGIPVEDVDKRLKKWLAEGTAVLFCPEVEGGLVTPRDPAEIIGEGGGKAVLDGTARVATEKGEDVTEAFVDGARKALAFCLEKGIRYALLQERSPSCGSHLIYDGRFQGTRVPGRGVTAALLEQHGIRVFSEAEIDALESAFTGSL
ncbi:DUF523 domain-containing protein [Desulfoluna butyratoxydans]|uniref:Uncharacterized protein n=1 Tax=Desulfoluna butyratoxydans TaxID=231438 RepID=A0A4U8YS70_9BACT|nr:DUF523 domain-containing protein [Desulfoluna butyratoxydans]VFQ44123.1 domain of unknown function duf523 [Desulfoluna butyratoxydans]